MDVPIHFEANGKQYHGIFTSVSGGGNHESNHWHLMIDGYYHGQFIYTQNYGWLFTSQTREFEDLSWFFEFYMVSYFQ